MCEALYKGGDTASVIAFLYWSEIRTPKKRHNCCNRF